MNQVNMTPAEMVKYFQEAFPHTNVRLSRPGDPELSSVLINFYPESTQSKALLQRDASEKKIKEKAGGDSQNRRKK